MDRLYKHHFVRHFAQNRQMLLVSGARQVGKTTTTRAVGEAFQEHAYYNWDRRTDRAKILRGAEAVAADLRLDQIRAAPPLAIFDELHKYRRWKTFLKGLFDGYEDVVRILVTGSARLDVFKAGGDSMMGRYFPFRMHPLSIAEVNAAGQPAASSEQQPLELVNAHPRSIEQDALDALWRFGGFPEPFLRQSQRFYRRWRRLRSQQLFKEDLRDLTRIQELGQVEHLAMLIEQRAGQLTSYTSLANAVDVSIDTVKRWLNTLQALYFCFAVRPWFRNVARALRKEPKYYLWDWSLVKSEGARVENFVASALLKAVHFWTDLGLGDFELRFVRDKQKREVDFLIVRYDEPWFLVEVKLSATAKLSPHLKHFQTSTGARHAFQVAWDMPFVGRDCFDLTRPMIVPARTLLAQLV